MHNSQHYLVSCVYPAGANASAIVNSPLSQQQAGQLVVCLEKDACDYLHSASISFGDAISGIGRQLFTWATVKLYYSVFYALRARLALHNICLFYSGSKPYTVHGQAGALAKKEKGQTHKIVLNLFRVYGIDAYMLSQPIDLEDPLEWLTRLR